MVTWVHRARTLFFKEVDNGVLILRNCPDWARRAIRLSVAMLTLGLVGHLSDDKYTGLLRQASTWGAITCVVVTAPLIGKVAEVSVFRTIGTIAGGFLGFMVWQISYWIFNAYIAGVLVVAVAPLMVVPTTYLAFKHSADQLSKFVQLTYLIVGYNAKPEKSAAALAALRVAGIVSGSLLSLALAVIILPRSASVESCREMKKALRSLTELNRLVWSYSATPVPEAQGPRKARVSVLSRAFGEGVHFPSSASGLELRGPGSKLNLTALAPLAETDTAKREGEVEKLFAGLTGSLSKVEDMLEQSKGEIYIHHLYGRYFFLPSFLPQSIYGIKVKQVNARWHLPVEDMKKLIIIVRRIARLEWTLFCDFEDGMDETFQQLLSAYPKQLMSELSLYCHKAITDLATAFPGYSAIAVDNLLNLGQLVECLMQISEARNRDAVFRTRRRRDREGRVTADGAVVGGTRARASGDEHPHHHGSLIRRLTNTSTLQSGELPSTPSAAVEDDEHRPFLDKRQPLSNAPQPTLTSVPLGAAPGKPFLSRALSTKKGEAAVIELPPRRLQRLQQAAAAGTSPPAPGPSPPMPQPAAPLPAVQNLKGLAIWSGASEAAAGCPGLRRAGGVDSPFASQAHFQPMETIMSEANLKGLMQSSNTSTGASGPDTPPEPPHTTLGSTSCAQLPPTENRPDDATFLHNDLTAAPTGKSAGATPLLEAASLGGPAWQLALTAVEAQAPPTILNPLAAHEAQSEGMPAASQPLPIPTQPAPTLSGLTQLRSQEVPHRSSQELDGALWRLPGLKALDIGKVGSASTHTGSLPISRASSINKTASASLPSSPRPVRLVGPLYSPRTSTLQPAAGGGHALSSLGIGIQRMSSLGGAMDGTALGLCPNPAASTQQLSFDFGALAEQASRPLDGSGARGRGASTPGAGGLAQALDSGQTGSTLRGGQHTGVATPSPSPTQATPMHAADGKDLGLDHAQPDLDLVKQLLGRSERGVAADNNDNANGTAPTRASNVSHAGDAGDRLHDTLPGAEHDATVPLMRAPPASSPPHTGPTQPAGLSPTPSITPSITPSHFQRATSTVGGSTGTLRFATLPAAQGRSSTPSHGGVGPSALASRLESAMSLGLLDPISFPETEEGYVSQVRWHSLQFILDELVEELEEAFVAASSVMGKLPWPIN